MRRLALLFALIAAFASVGATSAQASPWVLTNLNLGDTETIFGMHCEASGFCVGVGQEGVMVQSTAPTAGALAWSIGHVALGENLTANLRGISCPTASLCVAVDFSGGVWTTTNPALGPSAWTPTKIPKAKSLFAVSCSSPTSCVLVGSAGLVVTSTNPTGGASAWTRATLPGGPPLRAVSCTGELCMASAFSGELWSTLNPTGGATAWTSVGSPAGENPMLALTCWNAALCVAGDEGYVAATTTPTVPSGWFFNPLSRRFQIVGASCATSTLCVLSSNNGEVSASTNPLGGPGAFVTEHLIKGVTNALFGLSCPSETLCVAAGKFGQLLTSTQPAATGLPEPPPPPPPPTTVFKHTPAKVIHLGVRTPAPSVAFTFGATGSGPYWFRCKLDAKPAAICRPPRKSRVGVGKHVFRVRAFGPGGGSATQLVYKFTVVRAKPKPKPKPKPKVHKHGAK
jgi:hypothetical protein